jgi:hypothetical protein
VDPHRCLGQGRTGQPGKLDMMPLFRKRKEQGKPNGDRLMDLYANGDPGIRRIWDLRLAEGLTLEDLRQFYNEVPADGIEIMNRQDNLFRAAVWKSLVEDKGMTESEATYEAKRCMAWFGSPDPSAPPSGLEGEDRPLPHELKLRVNAWLIRQAVTPGQTIDYRSRGFTSVNAMIRAELRDGSL